MPFIEQIFAEAKTDRQRIVLPESLDQRVLEAAVACEEQGLAEMILIGSKEKSQAMFPALSLDRLRFIDPAKSELTEGFEKTYYELRKAKGMTPEKAKEVMQMPIPFGVMLVKEDLADGLVAGAMHSTADTLRPALQILRTKPSTKLVSAFFIMVVPNCEHGAEGTFLFADCALNENPDAEQVAEIAIASADSFQFLTKETPKIAMCSYSSFGSGKSPMVQKMVDATALAKEKAPHLILDGELQIDSALVPKTAQVKAPQSRIQGDANCLIFPDLNTGNISYKLTQYLAKAEAYGPLLQGIAKPVNDLSRGCSVQDIIGVVAITAVQALAAKDA